MKRFCTLCVIFAATIAAFDVSARIISIPDDYGTIQAGIDASANGDTVLVQPGTYHERINFDGHNILLGSLFLTTGDTAFIASTIIDGDSAGTVVTIDSGEDSTTAISGFTISDGFGVNGGGIYCIDSRPIVRNNSIIHNMAFGYPSSRGGGIYCQHSGARIVANWIANNIVMHPDSMGATSYGGGLALYRDSSTVIDSNIIEMNQSLAGWGGGVSFQDCIANISNNMISNNVADAGRGGGIGCEDCSGIVSANNIYANNAQDGGGISIFSFGESGLLIQDNLIKGNGVTVGYAHGGGIYCMGSAIISGCSIDSNQADQGGGIFGFFAELNIINCKITSNTISNRQDNFRGTAIHIQHSTVNISNCTVSDNYTDGYGDVIHLGDVTADMINCIVWNNAPSSIGLPGGSHFEATYCDSEYGLDGQGNISDDPLFRDFGDYRLSALDCGQELDSPCIDAGSPDSSDAVLDCSHGLGTSRSDMGAFGGR